MVMTILMILFFMYQTDVSRIELRAKNSLYSITDYAVRITNLPKNCPEKLEYDIRNQFIKFGKIHEIVPLRKYTKILGQEIKINKIGEHIEDIKAIDQLKGKNRQNKINKLVLKEQKLNISQSKAFESLKKGRHTKDYIVVFDLAKSKIE